MRRKKMKSNLELFWLHLFWFDFRFFQNVFLGSFWLEIKRNEEANRRYD